MIPKKIHCCWLGGGNFPPKVQHCIESWQRELPDYEIIIWDENRFDIRSVPWVRRAFRLKKYAFAADYIRHYALYTEGGIYLDTDIEIRKPFDELLAASRIFTVVEVNEEVHARNIGEGLLDREGRLLTQKPRYNLGLGIQSAAFGSEAGHPYLRKCLDWYESHRFRNNDGQSYYGTPIAPDIMAWAAIPYGFRYRDEEQELADGIHVYPSHYVACWPDRACASNYAVHHCIGSWRIKRKKWYSRWWKGTMRRLGLHK